MQATLSALWVYMIYAMIRYGRNHYNEKYSEITILLLFLLFLMATSYFGIAAQALDDAESRMQT